MARLGRVRRRSSELCGNAARQRTLSPAARFSPASGCNPASGNRCLPLEGNDGRVRPEIHGTADDALSRIVCEFICETQNAKMGNNLLRKTTGDVIRERYV